MAQVWDFIELGTQRFHPDRCLAVTPRDRWRYHKRSISRISIKETLILPPEAQRAELPAGNSFLLNSSVLFPHVFSTHSSPGFCCLALKAPSDVSVANPSLSHPLKPSHRRISQYWDSLTGGRVCRAQRAASVNSLGICLIPG